ncbi:MAG: hypothetical protein HY363_01930 [Candidatus Aenigmarchaeota archaeon]|nr:hypothetical protein [Candidatus Aenigmarchaeota archaeon]
MQTQTQRDVVQISNELELSVHNVLAADVICAGKKRNLSLLPEVNPRDVVELNVSLANNVAELNRRAANDIFQLTSIVESLGGIVYGGGSVLEDVSEVEPVRHRTTSLSNTFARGILDINSQQIILGVNDETLGFEIYNYFRHIRPALLALSASSPYKQDGQQLTDTGCASRRVQQYEKALSYFPQIIFNSPELDSLHSHRTQLKMVSDRVKEKLEEGILDANWEELKKTRQKGTETYHYYPFEVLEPHQVFWPERPRPDHRTIEKGGKSVFSIELRMPDMPITIWRIQMINSFVAGIAYYIAGHGTGELPYLFNENSLKRAAQHGLKAQINGISMTEAIQQLSSYAVQGLNGRDHTEARKEFEKALNETLWIGCDAEIIREKQPRNPDQLRQYLAGQLKSHDADTKLRF